jgi:RHS repeat-associated protein
MYFLSQNITNSIYPFGSVISTRAWVDESTGYRYSFNGKEDDKELNDWQDYGMRMYMKRLVRFPSPDPISKKYPYLSPYQFASNSPILGIDLDGLEFANPILMLRKESPVLMAVTEGVTASLTNTWNFFTHDAWQAETWQTVGEFAGEMGKINYQMRYAPIDQPFPQTPIMDAIAQNIQENIIEGDAYTRIKAVSQIVTDAATAYAGGKGLAGLTAAAKVTARTNLATQFYKKAGYTGTRAAEHMTGINFEKAVQTTTLKKGTVVQQWVGEDGVGNYFTPLENGASKNLGISYEGRTLQQFTLTEDVKVLQSTAADIGGNAGGGTQYFNTELKGKITPVE